MATGVKSWSTTAADNSAADSTIGWAEGQSPASVNDSARAMMARIADWYLQIDGGTVSGGTVGGSASAITLTCSPTVDARAAGQRYLFKLGSTITGATTLAVDGLAAGAIQWNQAALVAGDFAANDWVLVADDGTNYQLITPPKLSKFAQINNLTADGTGATGDKIPTYDISTSLPKYILISTLQTLLAASAAQQETGTSTAVNVTPGVQHRHASAAKAWINFNGSGTPTARDSYNISSITDNGTGNYTLNFSTNFSGATYGFSLSCGGGSSANSYLAHQSSAAPTASAFRMQTVDLSAPGIVDATWIGASFFGDQ